MCGKNLILVLCKSRLQKRSTFLCEEGGGLTNRLLDFQFEYLEFVIIQKKYLTKLFVWCIFVQYEKRIGKHISIIPRQRR